MTSTEMTVEQARAKLGDLVIAAMRGDTTTITRYGRAVAQIGPITETMMYIRTDDDGVQSIDLDRIGNEVREILRVDGVVCDDSMAYQSDSADEVDDYLRRRHEELRGEGYASY
jgi:antitoxin (DNA-binding transcriptional repressor) of toxin-antitoxin stability system